MDLANGTFILKTNLYFLNRKTDVDTSPSVRLHGNVFVFLFLNQKEQRHDRKTGERKNRRNLKNSCF